MIKIFLRNMKTGDTRWGDESMLDEWNSSPDLWMWADFSNLEQQREKEIFAETFKLHPLAISDAQRKRHPPKLEAFDEHFFVLMQELDATASDIAFSTIQVAFFVGKRFLVTRHDFESTSIDNVQRDIEAGQLNPSRGSGYIAYSVLRRLTDRYTKLVESLEPKLEDIETEMFEHPRDSLLEKLMEYGRNLKKLRRIFTYHQEIFSRLSRKDYPILGKQERHEFLVAFEHTERLTSLTTLYKEVTDELMNGYISITSHRLNQIMKILTVVTVTFMPLTLIAGIYGMNFENMPELKIEKAYYVLLGVMGFIVCGLLLLFRKMKWL